MGILAITIIFNLFGWPNLALIPVIGTDNLSLDPRAVGLLASMEGMGAIAGVLTIYYLGKPAYHARCMQRHAVSGRTDDVRRAAFRVTGGAALFLTGLAGSSFGIMQSTLAFRSVEPQMRARMLWGSFRFRSGRAR